MKPMLWCRNETDAVRRISKANAQVRNEFITNLAAAVLIPHAPPGGKTETLARSVKERGIPLFTFNDDANIGLLRLGAQQFNTSSIQLILGETQEGESNG